jgi:hypothetical protein
MFNTTGAGYRLSQLGKYVAFETGVVKDWSCDGVGAQAAFNLTVQHMDVFDIKPAFVNMDEPLLSGRAAPCTQSDDVTVSVALLYLLLLLCLFFCQARAVVRWMNQATQHVPQLQINDVKKREKNTCVSHYFCPARWSHTRISAQASLWRGFRGSPV